jgi:hypothetical protein
MAPTFLLSFFFSRNWRVYYSQRELTSGRGRRIQSPWQSRFTSNPWSNHAPARQSWMTILNLKLVHLKVTWSGLSNCHTCQSDSMFLPNLELLYVTNFGWNRFLQNRRASDYSCTCTCTRVFWIFFRYFCIFWHGQAEGRSPLSSRKAERSLRRVKKLSGKKIVFW